MDEIKGMQHDAIYFDEIPDQRSIEEKIKAINEFAERLSEAIKPTVERLIKAFNEFGKTAAAVSSPMFSENFQRIYMSAVKKERHQKKYSRMMARRAE